MAATLAANDDETFTRIFNIIARWMLREQKTT